MASVQAGPLSDAAAAIGRLNAKQTAEVRDALHAVNQIPTVATKIHQYLAAPPPERDEDFVALKRTIEFLARAEGATTSVAATAQTSQIKASRLFHDSGAREQNSWVKNSLARLAKLQPARDRRQSLDAVPSVLGQIGVYFMWTVVAVVVAILIFAGFRHANWRRALSRKSKAIVDDDEPERSLDEWLDLADEHERAGRFRDAVRALYLACLLQFDEARIARFDRGETNWEHLYRVEASPRLPTEINFRTTTQSFDHIWYGRTACSAIEVAEFRNRYLEIKSAVQVPTA